MSEKASVLLVDDDADIRETMSEFLQDEGFGVKTAAHGAEALDLLRGGLVPCAILLDLTMPVMDGYQFRAEQLRDPSLAGVPVIVITAGGRLRQAPIDAPVLKKPVDLEELVTRLRQYC